MREIMRRIAELKAMRQIIMETPQHPEMWPAAMDFIDNSIAVHEADLEAMVKAA